ncbi:MAG: hypothetical protein LBC02_10455, partial [Planctomycetaceae bacterium]|nr:hypothetical protein [Planctomycetaceae bacterium]
MSQKPKHAKIKFKTKSKDNNTEPKEEEEHLVESFQTLLSQLATICKNECRIENKKDISFNTFTSPNAFQEELLN